MNRKNKKAFDLPREMALRSRIADFALMLNTTEKVDLVRALVVFDRIGNSLNMLEDAVNELIEGKEVA